MITASTPDRKAAILEELRKLPAFFRRDLLVTWSYKLQFFTDWINLIGQVVVFYFVSGLVNPSAMPTYGDTQTSYLQFVTIGIAVTSFLQVSLARVTAAIRNEQLQGTLETLLLTPTAPATFQIGSAMYELAYVPVRVVLFLGFAAVIFGVHYNVAGLPETVAVLVVFVPFVWGLGVISAAATLTYRRGTSFVGAGASALTITSGAYFPVTAFEKFPILNWLALHNPITLALYAIRNLLLGDWGWGQTLPVLAILLPVAAATLAAGVWAFRAALRREQRRGTLGLY
jgi:ABC-2 type transport system permease protein